MCSCMHTNPSELPIEYYSEMNTFSVLKHYTIYSQIYEADMLWSGIDKRIETYRLNQ